MLHISRHDFTLQLKPSFSSQIQIMGDQDLVRSPLPDLLDIPEWQQKLLQTGNEVWHRVSADRFNYRSLISIGLYSRKHLFYPPSMTVPQTNEPYPAQDPSKFDSDVLKVLNAHFPPGEISLYEQVF